VDFAFSEEQDDFRETLQRFLAERAPTSEVRRLMETPEGSDRALWKQMAEELGLQGVHIPEAYGGQGFGFLELGIVMEELGRALQGGPFFSTVCLAANAILNAGSDTQRKALLPGIADGSSIATLALLEESASHDPNEIALVARPEGDGFVLDGSKRHVSDAQDADWILVAARLPETRGQEGITLVTVRGDAPGLAVEALETLDLTRKQAHLEFDAVSAQPLGQPGGDATALRRTLDHAAIALALENTGGAARCLDMAVAYSKQRFQFARPIGSFQAVKHKCAEMLLNVECASACSHWASWVAQDHEEELVEAACTALSVSTDAYLHASQENLQIHGGIGFTWEADPHLFFKRAKSNESLLGHPTFHRARLTRQLGL
jgi:alkylation response protein AidB-like acyl-CoA dehydrogenase